MRVHSKSFIARAPNGLTFKRHKPSGAAVTVTADVPVTPETEANEAIKATMQDVKDWCKAEQSRNGTSEISIVSLQDFIEKTLKIAKSSDVVQKALDSSIIMPSSNPGMVVVV